MITGYLEASFHENQERIHLLEHGQQLGFDLLELHEVHGAQRLMPRRGEGRLSSFPLMVCLVRLLLGTALPCETTELVQQLLSWPQELGIP